METEISPKLPTESSIRPGSELPKLSTEVLQKQGSGITELESIKSKNPLQIMPVEFDEHESISEQRKPKQPPSLRSKASVKDKDSNKQSTFVTGVPTSESAATMKEVQIAHMDLNSRIDVALAGFLTSRNSMTIWCGWSVNMKMNFWEFTRTKCTKSKES